jgi:hypothetical protein
MWTEAVLQQLLDQLANSLSRRVAPGGSETAHRAPLNPWICNTSVEQLVQGGLVVRCINDASSGQEGSKAQLMLVNVLTKVWPSRHDDRSDPRRERVIDRTWTGMGDDHI